MKKIIIFMIGVLLFSCSKKEDDTKELSTYKATVKENFTSPAKQIENIQIYDFVPYSITIEDDEEGSDIEYRLTSIRQQAKIYHQTIWVDFGLFLTNDENKAYLKYDEKYISFHGKGTHNFYIRPFVPGTFKHIYELQKFVGGKPKGEKLTFNISFVAVNIYAYAFKTKEGYPSSFGMKILDGDEEGDNYLSDEEVSQIYKAEVTGWDNEGRNKRLNFEGILPYTRNLFLGKNNGITREGRINFRIEQRRGNLPPFIIEYNGLYIRNL